MRLENYKPGEVIYFRQGRVSWPGRVLPAKEVYVEDEDGGELEMVFPVENLRNGEVCEPAFGWKTVQEYDRYIAEGKIKIGAKEKVA